VVAMCTAITGALNLIAKVKKLDGLTTARRNISSAYYYYTLNLMRHAFVIAFKIRKFSKMSLVENVYINCNERENEA